MFNRAWMLWRNNIPRFEHLRALIVIWNGKNMTQSATYRDKGSITQEADSYSEYIIPIVQNGGSSIMLWASFA